MVMVSLVMMKISYIQDFRLTKDRIDDRIFSLLWRSTMEGLILPGDQSGDQVEGWGPGGEGWGEGEGEGAEIDM